MAEQTNQKNDNEQPDSTAKPQSTESGELTEKHLDKVSGGKAALSDISITKTVDKTSPKLM